jgi:uncharacterized protein YndB with AHSA1/START domain
MATKITINAAIHAPIEKVWDSYTNPQHIVHWNFADPSWHCPSAVNDMQIGGTYHARMEAKDGSFGFDFKAIYTEIIEGKQFTYSFDGREANVVFNNLDRQTEVIINFDPENENPIELQQQGWQSILNNFKKYVENKEG